MSAALTEQAGLKKQQYLTKRLLLALPGAGVRTPSLSLAVAMSLSLLQLLKRQGKQSPSCK